MVKCLKTLRQQNGISQQQLANVLGVSQQSINKYENHNIEPDITLLIAMAEYFGVSIDFLVGRTQCIEDTALTEKELCLIRSYRSLKPSERCCVDTLIENFKK